MASQASLIVITNPFINHRNIFSSSSILHTPSSSRHVTLTRSVRPFTVNSCLLTPVSSDPQKTTTLKYVMEAGALTFSLTSFLSFTTPSALAASGGRMGGSSFSSSSSRSSSSSYRSSSSPSSTRSSPSYSSSSSRSSSSSSPSYSSSSSLKSSNSDPGSDGLTESVAVSPQPQPRSAEDLFIDFVLTVIFILISIWVYSWCWNQLTTDAHVDKPSVVKLQVGLLGSAKSLQKELNHIAEGAYTSTPGGLNTMLKETITALLRHADYCISGYSCVDVKNNVDDVEKQFNKLSMDERSKFDEETLVNVNNNKRKRSYSKGSSGVEEYVVVTILAAVEGLHKLPSINGIADLKEALHELVSVPASKTMAVEVLWTPQEEGDVLSELEY